MVWRQIIIIIIIIIITGEDIPTIPESWTASTAENMEKSAHTNFNEDTTNESASLTGSKVRLWKLDTQNEWRYMSWQLWDERTLKSYVGFTDS